MRKTRFLYEFQHELTLVVMMVISSCILAPQDSDPAHPGPTGQIYFWSKNETTRCQLPICAKPALRFDLQTVF